MTVKSHRHTIVFECRVTFGDDRPAVTWSRAVHWIAYPSDPDATEFHDG
jgi:hypothetical protein